MNYSAKHPVVVSVINNYVSEKFSADQIINYRLHLAKGIVAGYANSGSTTVPPTVETSSTSRVNKRRRGSIEPKEKQEIHENLGQQTSKRARRK